MTMAACCSYLVGGVGLGLQAAQHNRGYDITIEQQPAGQHSYAAAAANGSLICDIFATSASIQEQDCVRESFARKSYP
jgi:hypothetical protein